MASRNSLKDNAVSPLFTSVGIDAISGATYKAFKKLISFYNQPDAAQAELLTPEWQSAIDSFLDSVMNTLVMKKAQQFLIKRGIVTDNETFKTLLHSLWFSQYARETEVGSSGFESVFAGEILSRGASFDVIRFSNWLRFYELENLGQINYHGWFTKQRIDHCYPSTTDVVPKKRPGPPGSTGEPHRSDPTKRPNPAKDSNATGDLQ
ncbi:Endoribonuclease XendoU, partial [Trichostrongylus colubriformis]